MNGPGAIDSALERFHRWLEATRADAETPADAPSGPAPGDTPRRAFGLIDLVEEFTALRQELKLQTRSTRGLQEQSEALLPALRQAIEHFRSVSPREEQAAWSAGKPIALALATLDEALDRCRGEIDKAQVAALEEAPRNLAAAVDRLHAGLPWLRRLIVRSYHRRVKELLEHEVRAQNRAWTESLLEGFELIQNRVRRVLKSEAIEPVDCLGRPVDPERMIVIETSDAPDQPPGTVIEELRRGYTWNGRILRLAEVRAVRGRMRSADEEDDEVPETAWPTEAHEESAPDNGSVAEGLEQNWL